MVTIIETAAIAAAHETTTNHAGAYATCRVIDHEAPGCQEWAERCEIDGAPAKVYYIFSAEEAEIEEASEMPWDSDHVSKIEIAEKDEDGDYEAI